MNWILFWIIFYLLLIIYFTLKHVKSGDIDNYLVNNRKTKTLPLVATTLATFVGGGTSMGLMAMGYESGFAAIGIGIAYVIGFFILSRFAGQINTIGRKDTCVAGSIFLASAFEGFTMTAYFSLLISQRFGNSLYHSTPESL